MKHHRNIVRISEHNKEFSPVNKQLKEKKKPENNGDGKNAQCFDEL
jgi:hypothetical protein